MHVAVRATADVGRLGTRGCPPYETGYPAGSRIGSARIERRELREKSKISTGSVIRIMIGASAMAADAVDPRRTTSESSGA